MIKSSQVFEENSLRIVHVFKAMQSSQQVTVLLVWQSKTTVLYTNVHLERIFLCIEHVGEIAKLNER